MRAIYKKELRGFFTSMLGWLFVAANLFFAGWYFRFYGMLSGLPYINYVLNGIMLIVLFSIPVLTMRSFAEEMRQKTDQLLYTAPVAIWKIVLGKYLALLTVYAVVVAIIGIYPVFQMFYGEVPIGENNLALVGFFLFGAACIAIGMLISCLTENQIIAAVLSFFSLLVGIMVPGICNLISVTGNMLTRILSAFDLTWSLNNFFKGTLSLPGILYYLSIIAIALVLAIFVIDKRRWNVGSKGIVSAIASISSVAVLIIVIIAVNVAVNMIPESSTTRDITYNKVYSLSDESKKILDELETHVYLYLLADTNTKDDVVENTLRSMDDYSRKVTYQMVSPTENPYFYSAYTEANPTDNSIIVVCGDKSKVINYYDCYETTYEYEYDADAAQYVVTSYKVTGYDGEGRVIGALRNVSRNQNPKVYCITGHNEMQFDNGLSGLEAKLEKMNIELETINLLTYDTIPADAASVFILGPLKDYSDSEKSKIVSYLRNGGNAMFIVAYSDSDELTNFYSILEPYNISIHPGLVMEQGTSFYNSQQYYLLPEIMDTDLTKGIYSYMRNDYVYMPYCKGMLINEANADATVQILLRTTENAYALTDITGNTEVNDYDTASYALGVMAEKQYSDRVSKIAVFTSDYFLMDEVDSAANGNNQQLFINCLNELNGTTDDSLVPVKKYGYDTILINELFINIISLIIIVFIPFGLIFAGIYFWYSRRTA